MIRKIILHIVFLVFINNVGISQHSIIKEFRELSVYEKIWAARHPFVAIKSWKTTSYVKLVADSLSNNPVLDGNINGGQVDAFRHAFWMAILSQQIRGQKAYRLGLAHEKKSKKDFIKRNYEEGAVPDAISSKMDLLNNCIGLEIGKVNTDFQNQQLKELIIEMILLGELWIIKADNNGNFLDQKGDVLEKSNYADKWENDKCLVKSNLTYLN